MTFGVQLMAHEHLETGAHSVHTYIIILCKRLWSTRKVMNKIDCCVREEIKLVSNPDLINYLSTLWRYLCYVSG